MVTARCERAEDSLLIHIIPVPLHRLDVGKGPALVHPGDTFLLEATPLSAAGQVLADRPVTWSSDDTTVLTVSSEGRVEAKAVGSATVWARCEEEAVAVEIAVTLRPVAQIAVAGAQKRITVGDVLDLVATPKAADGTVLADRRVDWRSSAPGRRSDQEGRQAASDGRRTGPPSRSSPRKRWCRWRSRFAPSPFIASKIVSPPASLVKGESWNGSAVALDADGGRLEGREVRWTSTNPKVAAVDSDGSLQAVGAGRSTITASCGAAADSFVLQVEQRPVAQLELEAPETSLQVGQTVALEVSARSADGEYLEDRTMVWTSGNPDVARVGAAGVVEGLKPGVATITATCGRAAKSLVIQVFPIPVHHIDLAVPFNELEVGDRVGLSATPVSAAGEKLTERTIVWSSSDPGVATVDDTGFVAAVGDGAAAITASCDGVEAFARVTVRDPAAAVTEVFVAPPGASSGLSSSAHLPAPSAPVPPPAAPAETAEREPPPGLAKPTPAAVGAEASTSGGEGRRTGMWLGIGGVVVAAIVLISVLTPGGDTATPPAAGGGETFGAAADSVAASQDDGAAVAGAGGVAAGDPLEETDSVDDVSDEVEDPPVVAGETADADETETGQQAAAPAGPTTGRVEVVGGLPDGASVVVSGPGVSRRGVTGGEVELPPGTYRFDFDAPGYEARTTEVTVTAGGSHTVSGSLTREAPQEGTVRLGGGLPSGGVVTVSGSGVAPRALTAGPISLPPGQYRVEAEAPGFRSASETITVVAGRETVYSPTLEAEPEDPPEPAGPTPESVAPQLEAVFMALATVVEGQNLDAATSAYPGRRELVPGDPTRVHGGPGEIGFGHGEHHGRSRAFRRVRHREHRHAGDVPGHPEPGSESASGVGCGIQAGGPDLGPVPADAALARHRR